MSFLILFNLPKKPVCKYPSYLHLTEINPEKLVLEKLIPQSSVLGRL